MSETPLRRSSRIANKPKVTYITPKQKKVNIVVDTIRKVCDTYDVDYNSDFIFDFYIWYEHNKTNPEYASMSLADCANFWASENSFKICEEEYLNNIHN